MILILNALKIKIIEISDDLKSKSNHDFDFKIMILILKSKSCPSLIASGSGLFSKIAGMPLIPSIDFLVSFVSLTICFRGSQLVCIVFQD